MGKQSPIRAELAKVESLLDYSGYMYPIGFEDRHSVRPDITNDPHYLGRESLINFEGPKRGNATMQGVIPKLSRTPGSVESVGPDLGSHNKEIYSNLLGNDDHEIKALDEAGII